MKDLAYYNGKITSIDDMMIPANDRGFYFGDGIYEYFCQEKIVRNGI